MKASQEILIPRAISRKTSALSGQFTPIPIDSELCFEDSINESKTKVIIGEDNISVSTGKEESIFQKYTCRNS